MIVITTLSSRIKQRMKELRLTDKAVAEKIDVHYKTVQSWVNRNVQPSAFIAYQLSQILQCDFQWLITGFEAKEPGMVKELLAVYNINNKTDIKIMGNGSTNLNDPIIGKILKELEKADQDDLEKILRLIQLSLSIEKK